MFGKKRNHSARGPRIAPDEALFHNLLRGSGRTPIAAEERFPAAAEIANDPSLAFSMPNRDGKLFLGLVGAQMRTRNSTRYASGGHPVGLQDDRHAVIVAGSRAGKGRSLLLPILMTWPGSVIVIDPKLDLATELCAYRARALQQRVHVIDPFNAGGAACDPYRASYNPMQHPLGQDDDDLIDLASLIADGLVVRTPGKEPHWDESSQQFIEGVVLHVLTAPQHEQARRNLQTVYWLLMTKAEDGNRKKGIPATLEAEMLSNPAGQGAVAAAAKAFYDKEDRERSSVLSTIRRHLHFLVYPKIAAALQDGPVDPRTLHDEPTTIFVGLPATKMSTCKGLLRLFVNLSLASFEASSHRRDFQHQEGRLPVLVVMDEFFALGRLERIEAASGQIAGLGCKLLPVLQDLSQLKAIYPDSWETFLANAGVLSFFGNSDLTTLDWLEKRLGRTRVFSPSHNAPTYDAAVGGGATGDSYSLNDHPLMTVSEIARTFAREDPFCRQLVLAAGHGPMILQRAFYDQHELFKGLLRGT